MDTVNRVSDADDADCPLVTIHGISSLGAWQEEVESVFTPHFDYRKLNYPEYRRLGALKLVIEPWGLAIGAVVLAIVRCGAVFSTRQTLLAGIAVVMISHAASYMRRWRVRRKIKNELGELLRTKRPHVIAHSFGTYLIGANLRRHRFHTRALVLTGCVLYRRYGWRKLWNIDPELSNFKRVRNEVARRDWVACMAGFLHGLVPGMGHAGLSGFREPRRWLWRRTSQPTLIHHVEEGLASCPSCELQPGQPNRLCVPIHNVIHHDLGHSDLHLGVDHAFRYWLPFLWSIEPREFERLRTLCERATRYEEAGDDWGLTLTERALQREEWEWAGGRTLPDILQRQLRFRHLRRPLRPMTPEIRQDYGDFALRVFWRLVARAAAVNGRTSPNAARALYPWFAVVRAVNAVTEAQ